MKSTRENQVQERIAAVQASKDRAVKNRHPSMQVTSNAKQDPKAAKSEPSQLRIG